MICLRFFVLYNKSMAINGGMDYECKKSKTDQLGMVW